MTSFLNAGRAVFVSLVAGLVVACSPTPDQASNIGPVTQSSAPAPVPSGASGADDLLQAAMLPQGGIFGPASEWRRDISGAPTASDSAALVGNLAEQVRSRYDGVAAFNLSEFNVAVAIAGPEQPAADVTFDDCQGKGYVPPQLYSTADGAPFRDVPIPDDAVPASGTDGELTVWQPSTDTLWELWKANKRADGWHACWGGRIDAVSASPGYFQDPMGVAATGLSVTGGSIGIRDALAGKIEHAMSLVVVDAAHYSEYSYPAQRSDGGAPAGTPHQILEGQRFRLDPSIDIDALGLTPVARMVAKAAQTYGFIVSDKGGAVSVVAESGSAASALSGSNPWQAIMGDVPAYAMMRGFPWSALQALPPDYGRP